MSLLQSRLKSYVPPLLLYVYNAVIRRNRYALDYPATRRLRQLERIVFSPKPWLVGPWLSEVGFEILYWIPFLQWLQTRRAQLGLPPAEVTILSRGGNASWYQHVGSHYLNLFDKLTPEEFRHGNAERIAAHQTQKHAAIGSFDRRILQSFALKADDYTWIHPSLMYRLFMPFWARRRLDIISQRTEYRPLSAPAPILSNLPDSYVAVKFYFSDCFPATDANRAFAQQITQELAQQTPVVILDTGLQIDDHSDWTAQQRERIISVKDQIEPATNLATQTAIFSRARAFFGTYGGFSYLAPFYGVPSLSFYTVPNFVPAHLDMAFSAFRQIDAPLFNVLRTQDYEPLRRLLGGKG